MTQQSSACVPLQPLGFSDVLSSAFSIFAKGVPVFLVLGLAPGGIIIVLIALGVLLGFLALPEAPNNMELISPAFPLEYLGVLAAAFFIGTLVISLISFMVALVCDALSSYTALSINRGVPVTAGSLISWAGRYIGPAFGFCLIYLGIGFAVFLISALGVALSVFSETPAPMFSLTIALFIASLVIAIRLSLVAQVLGVEGSSAIMTLRNSWKLTEGYFWRVAGYILLTQILVAVITSTITSIPTSIFGSPSIDIGSDPYGLDPYSLLELSQPANWGYLAIPAINLMVNSLVAPFLAVFRTVLYLDLRRRKEGLAGQPLFV